ncbi:MAG: TIGR04141 family sporadically distributed protein [Cyclobacteriaceae bacterium]
MIHSNHDIKVYQINTGFYEFNNLSSSQEIVEHIIKDHKERFETPYDLEDQRSSLEIEPIDYLLYVFNEVDKESMWKTFLPKEITEQHDFSIQSTSFALFILIESEIFALIGGKGISVIKKFINHSFGLDLYEKIADPENDIVHSQMSRGVTGNLTSEQKTYRNEQKLIDSLSIGRVPNKFYLLLRQDLKDSVFDFIDFDDESVYLEIGSSFCLKWRLSFEQTHTLILKLVEILKNGTGKPLSRFERVRDPKFTKDSLEMALYDHLRNDMVRLNTPRSSTTNNLDFDFVHPQKLNVFYECDIYSAYTKGAKTPFFETRDRTKLYYEILKYLYGIVDQHDAWSFIRHLSGVRIRGFVGEEKKTEAMFINHLTCEISVNDSPYFLIDNTWYKVRGDFIETINDQCSSMLQSNELNPNPMNKIWSKEMDEGTYNLEYLTEEKFIVLDKMLGQNIELCDLLYETDSNIYLIHVKEGFDAKIRDVTNQVSISANRLWNDVKSDFHFVDAVYKRYSESSNFAYNPISKEDFRLKFKKDIIYVIAFCHNKINKSVAENIQDFKSNIAKFSIIQSVRDMQSNNYPLKITEVKRA